MDQYFNKDIHRYLDDQDYYIEVIIEDDIKTWKRFLNKLLCGDFNNRWGLDIVHGKFLNGNGFITNIDKDWSKYVGMKEIFDTRSYEIKCLVDISKLPLKNLDVGTDYCITDKDLPSTLVFLNATDNPRIKDVSHLPLKKLHAAGENCGITDKGLPLSLVKLLVNDNPNIKDISHLTSLKRVTANGTVHLILDKIPDGAKFWSWY